MKNYIGTETYISIKALLKNEGMEKAIDYYQNGNQEKILEELEQKFSREEFDEFKKLVTEKATIDYLGSDEKFEGRDNLSKFLLENCSVDLNIVLNDYIKLDNKEFVKFYRSRC